MGSKRKKLSVGIIYYKTYHDYEDKMLPSALKKIEMGVVLLPAEEQIDFKEIEEKTKRCKIIYNDTVCQPILFESLELSKTLEELGKKVINSSYSFFYQEDKWMFYLKCLEHRIPTPKTYLIPKETRYNVKAIKELLKNKPMVLKGVFSDNAKLVEKVTNYPMFLKKLRRIVKMDPTSPIVAQEYIPNSKKSYRATLINYKLRQFIVKISKSWKQSGHEREHFRSIKINKKLRHLCERTAKVLGMQVCGLDLIFNDGKWYIIEANSSPSMDFIYHDERRLVKALANYLCSESKKLG
ncbi:ATP-grasp domain-containing protein [Candidatus Woesearchaeota archaeon]|nr:ATP-grasp domain-containing protein [Candidatus Woesearchaeota archaeon]